MIDTSKWSLKRLAWAYGCAAKGSPLEAELLSKLLERARAEVAQ